MQLYYSKISLIVLVRAVRQNGTLLGRASRRLSACFCKLKMSYAIEFSFYFKLLLSLFLFEKAFAAIALLQTVELFSRWRWTNGSTQSQTSMGGSPGLVVMGGDSCTEGRGFESQHHILVGHFSQIFVVKIVTFVWKDETKWKRRRGLPILKGKQIWNVVMHVLSNYYFWGLS